MHAKKSKKFKAAVFDLDGVIVNTVPFHFKAWRRMFREYGKKFTFEDYKKKVDGIPRLDGLKAILTTLSGKELQKAAQRKQNFYLEYLKKEKIPIYKSTVRFIKDLRRQRIKIAVVSSSKNCSYILQRTKLYPLVDVEVNGNEITKGKPHPQMFLMAAKRLKVKAGECVGFEDAVLGVEAVKRAGMKCVGVDRYQNPQRLKKADIVISDLREVDISKLEKLFHYE
jgi:beta-phosphoglucomutase